LISLDEDPPPPLQGIVTYHLPPSLPEFQRLSDTSYDATEALQAAGLTFSLAPYRQPTLDARRG
jgi:hypothetical protein